MEIMARRQEKSNPSRINSSNINGSNNNGGFSSSLQQAHVQTPITISRSEANLTTFVQADTSTFKQVVQMLTGSSETAKQASKTTTLTTSDPPQFSNNNKGCIPIIKTPPMKQSFKLYERRATLKNGLMINPSAPAYAKNSGFSPRMRAMLSPSILDFPSLVLSPVTPLTIQDHFNKSSPLSIESNCSSEEEKAIAEKKFYLHPSPRTTTPRAAEPPKLLPLFPVTSPKISGSSSSSFK